MKVRFPNESYYIEAPSFSWSDFKPEKIFDDIVFGWWGDTYVSVEKKEYNNYINKR